MSSPSPAPHWNERKKIRVAILYGGCSGEHEVSVTSAKNIEKHIDREIFDVHFCGISKEGSWFLTPGVSPDIEKGKPLDTGLSKAHRLEVSDLHSFTDVIFSVLHGGDGECGNVQGLLACLDIVFVGCDTRGCALAMDKILTRELLRGHDIPVLPWMSLDRQDIPDFETVTAKLGSPLMLKCPGLGSSIGIWKISNRQDYRCKVEEAGEMADELLVEPFLEEAREFECGVLGNQQPLVSPVGEIVVSPDYEFYTYQAKYKDAEAVSLRVPALISPELSEKIRRYSLSAFKVLRCRDYARVDFLAGPDGLVWLSEINTIPGFTSASMFPLLFQEAGISFAHLITRLIREAHTRGPQGTRPVLAVS